MARTSSWSESWRGLGFWLTYFFDFSGGLARPQATAYFTQPAVIVASFVAPVGALIALALGALAPPAAVRGDAAGLPGADGRDPRGRRPVAVRPAALLRLRPFGVRAGLPEHLQGGGGPDARDRGAPRRGRGRRAWRSGAAQSGRAPVAGSRTRLRPLALGVVVPVFVAVGVVVASFPFWTDRLYSDDGFKSIPQYWDRTFDYLEAQEQPGRVLVLPGTDHGPLPVGPRPDGLFDGLSPLSPVINRPLPQGTAESADLVAAIDEYVSSPGYVKGTLGPILARLGVRWVLLQNDLDWQRMDVPRPSTYDALRADPGLRLAATFGRPGENTASPGDLGARLPRRARAAARGDLQGGRGALAAAQAGQRSAPSGRGRRRLLAIAGEPPGCWTGRRSPIPGAAQDEVLREMVASGSERGGDRRQPQARDPAATERPSVSPTLAARRAQRPGARTTSSAAARPRAWPPTPMRPGSPRAATGSR